MKHPVPKYKKSKSRSSKRHSMFSHLTQVRLQGVVNLVDCPNCKMKKLNHHVCQNCGQYNGKKILDMNKAVEKITKVKA